MSNKGSDENGAKQQEQNLELRRAINNAYAFIEGQKLVQSFSAVTIEELMDQQIERIEGKSTTQKPNEIDRINKTETELIAAVENIKKMPDDAFRKTPEENGVNTPP
jgi:hypothetical protein